MSEALARQLDDPQLQALSFDERLGLLVDHEIVHRDNRRLARLLRTARLRVNACVEDIDYRHQRGLKKRQSRSSASWAGYTNTTSC